MTVKDTIYLDISGETVDCEEFDISRSPNLHMAEAKARLKERNFTAILEGDSWCIYYVRVPG